MTWLEVTIDGRRIRIDSQYSFSIQMWREYKPITKPNIWRDTHIEEVRGRSYINIEKRRWAVERLVYKAHNPEWDILNYSKHNQIKFVNGYRGDCSIDNLVIEVL